MTADELIRLPREQFRYELVNGELIHDAPLWRSRSPSNSTTFSGSQILDGGEILPGFRVELARLFEL